MLLLERLSSFKVEIEQQSTMSSKNSGSIKCNAIQLISFYCRLVFIFNLLMLRISKLLTQYVVMVYALDMYKTHRNAFNNKK